MSKTRVFVDVAASISALYLSVWLYEIGNWVSLTAAGTKASLAWGGVLPVGVFAVTQGGTDLLGAKLLQVGICVGVALAALFLLRRRGLRMATVTLGGLTGIYVSSIYWEVLSLTAFIPVALHETVYVGMCVVTGTAILKALGMPLNHPTPLNG